MTNNEAELLKLINENDNPEQAILTAIMVFTAFLEQLEAAPAPQAVCPLVSS